MNYKNLLKKLHVKLFTSHRVHDWEYFEQYHFIRRRCRLCYESHRCLPVGDLKQIWMQDNDKAEKEARAAWGNLIGTRGTTK